MSDATPKLCSMSHTGIAQDFARLLVAAYRLTLSPLIGYNCRHLPTCSQYADEAFERHGFWAGGWVTLAPTPPCPPLVTPAPASLANVPPPITQCSPPW